MNNYFLAMNDNSTIAEIKYIIIIRVSDETILLQVAADPSKKAYVDEVIYSFTESNLFHFSIKKKPKI